jgi:tRNA modification GTPase
MEQISNKINVIKHDILSIIKKSDIGNGIMRGINIVIYGKPNAGKSTLFNYIAGSDAAIVSAIPGTTRDVLTCHLNICEIPVVLHDTAGLRCETEDIIEREGIKRAEEAIKVADIKILVVDSHENENTNVQDVDIVVFNKSDTVKADKYIYANHNAGYDLVLEELRKIIRNKFVMQAADTIVLNARHRSILGNTINYLDRFNINDFPEVASENLRLASREIEKITGVIDVEDILGSIFSKFCIGK